MFKRKCYDKLLEWKRESNGKSAVLVEGARRVGKTTLVREFAEHEYADHIYIDFSKMMTDSRTGMSLTYWSCNIRRNVSTSSRSLRNRSSTTLGTFEKSM